MALRLATVDDLPIITEMGMKFIDSTGYKDYADIEKIKSIAEDFVNDGGKTKLILLSEDKGMIVAVALPFVFGNILVATEVAWWVEPEARNSNVGKELLEAYEFWAKKVGCKLITMISLDEDLGKYYEKRGYKLYERAYMKEI